MDCIPRLGLDVDVHDLHISDGLVETLGEAIVLWMVGGGPAVTCLAVPKDCLSQVRHNGRTFVCDEDL